MQKTYTISQPMQDLLSVFNDQRTEQSAIGSKDEPKIKIHETVGKVAYAYEKVRNAVDYQDEHLLRKNAIARMLKRRIRTRERGNVITEPLLRELIRAGYLKNDYFPIRRIPDIEQIINKYLILYYEAAKNIESIKEKNNFFNWIIGIVSYEIEQYLSPTIKDDALVEAMYKIIRPHLNLSEKIQHPEDQDIQVYIAIHRALIKSDQVILRYHLIHYYAPQWRYMTPDEIPEFSQTIKQLQQRIESQINNKYSDKLFQYVRKYAPYFTIVKDVLNQSPNQSQQLIQNPPALEKAIRAACQTRYATASAKLTRGVVRSIIYIFLTKTIMAFVFELPYEAIVLKQIKIMPLAINVVFHPFLMFLIATSIRVPAEQNTQKIIKGIYEIIYNPPEKEIFIQEERTLKTSSILKVIFTFIYFIAYIITFGLIIWALYVLEFSIVSALLFLFFLSVISFFGMRLRNNAKELVVVSKKENVFMLIFDFFSLPILRAGRWISRNTSKVNVLMFILDFIIEAPFKVLIETIEDWVTFQRQKKEEIL